MNTIIILIGILGLTMICVITLVISLYKKITRLTKGKNGKALESIITQNNENLQEIKKNLKVQAQDIIDIKKDSLHNIQNIGVIRFNPFKETGGSQSFAIALTDKNKTGVVISSLFIRDRMNVFAKPIINGNSTYTLTNEEQLAINQSFNK